MQIQHVFFDLDHTLWDFEKNSDLTFEKIFLKYNIKIDIHAFLEVYKPINLNYWKLFRNEKVTKSELKYGRLKNTFDALNYTVSDDLIDLISVDYLDFLPHFNHLFPDAFQILDYLKNKYQLHIITNGFEETQAKKMESSKIAHYFDKVITSESVGVKKPNSKVFEFAFQITGANKDNSIMIGDSIEADIEGALNVGMKAIHCNFDQQKISNINFISITSLIGIKQYL
ncbi:YjjG family noncanonical pyrimidine nucleotidase [uncultured Polaribacter sp.]|uniref:YjjG family noncanonical pyrimidine nucleotidase n=1 Tax=uncultured Polaribacter sp. TaxID=174711 RepID=UPI00262F6BCA|nr:YjjG family noncanonical pyrimidine nucleotidase [uncultured Polaribacter sp.]